MKNFQQNAGSMRGQNSPAGSERQSHHPASQVHHGQAGNGTHAHSQQHPNQTPSHNERDEELGILFQQMRQLTGADLVTLASHLQTTPQILTTFENGEFDFFPPWAETVRIVSSLTLLVNVDCDPILNRISSKTRQPGPRRYTQEAPSNSAQAGVYSQSHNQSQSHSHSQRSQAKAPCSTQSSARGVEQVSGHGAATHTARHNVAPAARPGTGRQVVRQTEQETPAPIRLSAFTTKKMSMAAIPLIMVVAAFLAINIGMKSGFTGPLGNYAKAGWELFNFSSSDNGLRWIKVRDPRSRKSDKLPVNDNDY